MEALALLELDYETTVGSACAPWLALPRAAAPPCAVVALLLCCTALLAKPRPAGFPGRGLPMAHSALPVRAARSSPRKRCWVNIVKRQTPTAGAQKHASRSSWRRWPCDPSGQPAPALPPFPRATFPRAYSATFLRAAAVGRAGRGSGNRQQSRMALW